LHDHGSKRRQDEHKQRTDDAKAAIVVPPPAEQHAELRKHGDSAGNRSGNGHRQRVVITDVAEFVTDNAGDFVTVECVKEPSRRADGGVLRIPPCGKSIGLRAVHHVDPWHRQVRPLCQLAHNPHKFWRALLVNFLGLVHR
jgi:hypothetical protein